jgi:hypothetical protein
MKGHSDSGIWRPKTKQPAWWTIAKSDHKYIQAPIDELKRLATASRKPHGHA